MTRRVSFAPLFLLLLLALAACGRAPGTTADPGVDLGDPDVGGGAGVETGPQTPVPTGTATREASPRLPMSEATTDDATPVAPPQTTATSQPAVEATPDSRPPAAEATTDDGPVEPLPLRTATVEPTATAAIATVAATATTLPGATVTITSTLAGERLHVVQAGENLYRIGLLYGLSWVAIADYNGITDPNAITVGQELRIPPSPTATPETTADGRPPTTDDRPRDSCCATTDDASSCRGLWSVVCRPAPPAHTVIAGETLYAISRRYGVSWDQIAEANGLATPNQIYAGQVLKIPADAPGPTPEFGHQIHRGDTLSRLARQYGLSAEALAKANDLAAPFVLFPGQVLVIPSDE